MEVKLEKRYPVAATAQQSWAVLSDIHATAACMPGAQITEQVDATHFKGTVKSKVGPAVMVFNGDIELQGIDETKHELRMLGKGADKGGSSASMQLTAHIEPGAGGAAAADSVLVGSATIVVSGKLAQFGSRLLVPVSEAMLAQFADNFQAAAQAVAAPAPAPASSLPYGAESTLTLQVQGGEAPGALGPKPSAPASPPVKELNVIDLMWAVLKGWLAGLGGKKN